MEDSSRDLEKELKKYSVPNPFKRSGTWQMLFVSEAGKVIAIKRYKELFITVVAVLCVSVLMAVIMGAQYVSALEKNRNLASSLNDAEQARKELQDEKEHLQAQLLIPHKVLKTEKKAEPEKAPAQKTENPPAKKVVKKSETMKIKVTDLTLMQDEGEPETRIRFVVRNAGKTRPISGRVFVVLKTASSNPQDWLTMPPVSLKGGNPAMPSRGQFFSINNYKSVKFKFNNPFPKDHYKKMDVFVFSTEGEKVYEETFDVDLMIIKKPVPPAPQADETAKDAAAAKPDDTKPASGAVTPSDAQADARGSAESDDEEDEHVEGAAETDTDTEDSGGDASDEE